MDTTKILTNNYQYVKRIAQFKRRGAMQFSQEEVSGVLERMMFGICFGCARSFAVLHKEGESREEAIARIRKVHGPEHLGCSMRYSQSKDMKTVAETVVRELRRTQLPEIFIDETLKGALDEDQFADHLGRYYKDWARLALYPLAVNCEGLTHPIFSGGQLVLLLKEMRGDDIGQYTIRASVCTIEDKRPSVSDVYVDWK